MNAIKRRQSYVVKVGNKLIGGDAPVLVQSMTNTPTENALATAKQIEELYLAGSEIVRLTVNTKEAARALPDIKKYLDKAGIDVPLVGDFHYNGHLLLNEFKDCAQILAKYRINPGNVGAGKRHDENFKQMVEVAIANKKPVRIGVNWGSLDKDLLAKMMDENAQLQKPLDAHEVLKEAIVRSAIDSAKAAESYGLPHDAIILSAKVSEVQDLVSVYRKLAERCSYALHLGLTEAGMGTKGIVASTAALSVLLHDGIGDTIRVSLTPEPGASRSLEVQVCQQILQSMGIRNFTAQVTACPGCGRTTSTVFQDLAKQIQDYIQENKPIWQERFPGAESLKVAVMGCIVNGPGESKHADVGISLPGTGEEPRAPVFVDGEHTTTLSGPKLIPEFIDILNTYVSRRWG